MARHDSNDSMAHPYASTPPPLGKLVRMRALKATEMPAHPELGPQQSPRTCPPLLSFLAEALNESESFMTAFLPSSFKIKGRGRPSPPAHAKVDLLEREINGGETNSVHPTIPASRVAETWFVRRSIHENAAKEGTANWDEFDMGLRRDHSQHEMEYTPDVRDAHQVLSWDEMITEQAGDTGKQVGEWTDVQMSLMEMVHHIPPPLNDRVFCVLVITAKHVSGGKFLVVQIPADTTNMPRARYSPGKPGNPTQGMYTSVERGEIVEGMKGIKWEMGTASDAKGALPMFVQKLGTPGALVKDVGLFMDWCAKRRLGQA
ncbi:hypothetical protein B0A50_02036 [Salinomyces thailandicus]|uniref:DUF3074 domain-containing protein n=1 Tax=Salinomyces thailandicus TaxID=706561 RepID=A0A4U0U7I2_9PEZI|nr:hypothetical protein B0A50_02036 [Salinomyces thailandica]